MDTPRTTGQRFVLPNGRVIPIYVDRHGKLVTLDGCIPGGQPRLVQDICREFRSDSRTRPSDRPLPPPYEHRHLSLASEFRSDSRTRPSDRPLPPPCAEGEHVAEPASAQTPVPNRLRPYSHRTLLSAEDAQKQSRAQFIDEMLDKACASRNLQLSQPCEEGDHVPEPLVVPNITQTLQEPDVLSLKELLDITTLEKSSIAATSSSSPQAEAVTRDTIEVSPPSRHSSPPISARKPYGWPMKFLIRTDLGGSFHTYPRLGGPFRSLQEAENAIDRHLDDLQDEKMCMDGLSLMEINIRHSLYFPDGTRRNSSKSGLAQKDREHTYLLVQALLDKYNEDNNLLGDLAYELKDVVCSQPIYEGEGCPYMTYYHFNLTTKTKEADNFHCGVDNLYFAEVTVTKGEHEEFVLSCFCMVKPNDNGKCYGCTNRGCVDLKHPNDANEYKGGHLDTYLPYGGSNIQWGHTGTWFPPVLQLDAKDEDARMEAEEARIKRIFKCLDDPCFLEIMARVHKDDPRAESVFKRKKEPWSGRPRVPDAAPPSNALAVLAMREAGHGRREKYIVPARRQGTSV